MLINEKKNDLELFLELEILKTRSIYLRKVVKLFETNLIC
jgi:hypothetical protein